MDVTAAHLKDRVERVKHVRAAVGVWEAAPPAGPGEGGVWELAGQSCRHKPRKGGQHRRHAKGAHPRDDALLQYCSAARNGGRVSSALSW